MVEFLFGKGIIFLDLKGEYCVVFSKFIFFLQNLHLDLERCFYFFGDYMGFLKLRNILKELIEFLLSKKVSRCFKKYVEFFCYLDINLVQGKEDLLF